VIQKKFNSFPRSPVGTRGCELVVEFGEEYRNYGRDVRIVGYSVPKVSAKELAARN
jgi:hypothetical protein